MRRVVDASVTVAALVDSGSDGSWAAESLAESALIAPHLMPVEVANVLRRALRRGELDSASAADAYQDLLTLPVALLAFGPFAERVWTLRSTLSAYDAWYVAMAEALNVELLTLDERIRRAPGVRCDVLSPGH
ncbi:MAG: type II toxin-antitoxin system VapC family toxin [Trueperaceae bacterium]|nr:type II toxin-antitoxin system VapC family toxin [Trueperaceae bacterium]